MSKKSKNKKRKQILYTVLLVFFACVFVCSGIYLGVYYYNSWKSERKVDDLKDKIATTEQQEATIDDTKPSDSTAEVQENLVNYVDINGVLVQEKFAELYRMNSDFIGWITVDGTAVDYPVMQTPGDEEFYLHKDFDKQYSLAGSLFADTDSDIRKPSTNIMIYGHHMQSGKMFQNLTKYE